MTRSVTKYEDYEYAEPIYAYESYEHRADGLFRSEKDLVKEIATDFYHKERPDGCKCKCIAVDGTAGFRSKSAKKERSGAVRFYLAKGCIGNLLFFVPGCKFH